MRVGIISDTHDQIARTGRAVKRLIDEGVQALFHCGDLTGPDVVYECGVLPAYFVFGNNDYDEGALRAAMGIVGAVCLEYGGEVTLGGRRIAMTHGDSAREMRRLIAAQPDFLFYGHTHEPHDDGEGPGRRINPGALHRAARWTTAVLELDTGLLKIVDVR